MPLEVTFVTTLAPIRASTPAWESRQGGVRISSFAFRNYPSESRCSEGGNRVEFSSKQKCWDGNARVLNQITYLGSQLTGLSSLGDPNASK